MESIQRLSNYKISLLRVLENSKNIDCNPAIQKGIERQSVASPKTSPACSQSVHLNLVPRVIVTTTSPLRKSKIQIDSWPLRYEPLLN